MRRIGTRDYTTLLNEHAARLGTTPDAVERPEGARPRFMDASQQLAERYSRSGAELLQAVFDRGRSSAYPTDDCIRPEEIKGVIGSPARLAEVKPHLRTCSACSTLVDAAKPSLTQENQFLAKVRAIREGSRVAVAASGAEGQTGSKRFYSAVRKRYPELVARSGVEAGKVREIVSALLGAGAITHGGKLVTAQAPTFASLKASGFRRVSVAPTEFKAVTSKIPAISESFGIRTIPSRDNRYMYAHTD